jgi:hypothetical protein
MTQMNSENFYNQGREKAQQKDASNIISLNNKSFQRVLAVIGIAAFSPHGLLIY